MRMASELSEMHNCGKHTILADFPTDFPQEYVTQFGRRFNVVTRDQIKSDESMQAAEQVVGVIYFPIKGSTVSRDYLAEFPNLKVFSLFCVGYGFLDLGAFRERGIRVFTLGDIQSEDLADWVLGVMVMVSRRLMEVNQQYKQDTLGFYQDKLWPFLGKQVSGSTLGIVGMGNIGYQVALRAKAFRMKILYHNRKARSREDESSVGAEFISKFHEMLPLVDFLVVCCPLSQATCNLIGKREFDMMKPTAVLINVARGKIVNTAALVAALENQTIAAAGLDVTDPEPLPNGHILLNMPNVFITPHVGASTVTTRDRSVEVCIDSILAGIDGRSTETELDIELITGNHQEDS